MLSYVMHYGASLAFLSLIIKNFFFVFSDLLPSRLCMAEVLATKYNSFLALLLQLPFLNWQICNKIFFKLILINY